MPDEPTHLLVVDKAAGELVAVDLESGEPAWRVPVGAGPHETVFVPAAVSPTGGPAALVSVYAAPGARGREVALVDLVARKVVDRLSTDPYSMPHGLALVPDASRFLATVEADDAVLLYDLSGESERAVFGTGSSLPHMVVVAPDGSAAFAANIRGGAVTRIDLRSGEVASAAVGAGAEGIAVSPAGGEVWVGSNDEHEVHIVAADDLSPLDVLPTCRVPIRVTPVGAAAVAVTCLADAQVTLYDAVSHEKVGTLQLPAGSAPVGTLATADGSLLYVAATATGTIHEVDVASMTVVRTFSAGTEPDGLALARIP